MKEPRLTAGKAKKEIPRRAKPADNIRPVHVFGVLSPYPIVVRVICENGILSSQLDTESMIKRLIIEKKIPNQDTIFMSTYRHQHVPKKSPWIKWSPKHE